MLDQPSVPARTPCWRNHLDVDRIICLSNTIRPIIFLGGGILVGRGKIQASLVERWSEGWRRTEAGKIETSSVSHHFLSHKFCSQISIIKLPPGILPRHPSSNHRAVCFIQSPQRTICGHIFLRLNFLSLWRHQCHPAPGYQTEAPPLPSPAGIRTERRYRPWPGNFRLHGELLRQSRVNLAFAGGWGI